MLGEGRSGAAEPGSAGAISQALGLPAAHAVSKAEAVGGSNGDREWHFYSRKMSARLLAATTRVIQTSRSERTAELILLRVRVGRAPKRCSS